MSSKSLKRTKTSLKTLDRGLRSFEMRSSTMKSVSLKGSLRRPFRLPRAHSRSCAAGLLGTSRSTLARPTLRALSLCRLSAGSAILRICITPSQGREKTFAGKTLTPSSGFSLNPCKGYVRYSRLSHLALASLSLSKGTRCSLWRISRLSA